MAKQSGLGATLNYDDSGGTARDISNDITNFSMTMPRGVQDVTGLDKSAMERLLLLADFQITANGVLNVAANKSHAVLKTVPSTSAVRTVGFALSSQTLNNECIITDYQLTRAQNGSMVWQAPSMLADGALPTWS